MYYFLIAALLLISSCANACVVYDPSGGTYTVDKSGFFQDRR